jgi:hypothetical protein
MREHNKHIFEQAAEVLGVSLDASPPAIKSAAAEVRGCRPALVSVATDVMLTSTPQFRVHAVRRFHKNRRWLALRAIINDTPEEAAHRARVAWLHEDDQRRREAILRNPDPVARSIGRLHLAFGHY